MATVSQVKAQFEKAKKVAKEFEEINKQYSEASLAKNFRTKAGKQKHDEIFSKWRPLVAAKEQEIGKLISLVGSLSAEEKSKEPVLMSSLKDFVMRNGGLGQKLQDSQFKVKDEKWSVTYKGRLKGSAETDAIVEASSAAEAKRVAEQKFGGPYGIIIKRVEPLVRSARNRDFKVNITDSAGKLDSITIQANSAVDASIMVSKLPHVKSVRSVDAEYKAKQFPSKADAAKFVKSNNIKDFIMEGTLENGEYMLRYVMPKSKDSIKTLDPTKDAESIGSAKQALSSASKGSKASGGGYGPFTKMQAGGWDGERKLWNDDSLAAFIGGFKDFKVNGKVIK